MSELDQLRAANTKLWAANAKMRAALMAAEDYFDGRADVVDGFYGKPHPNAEMQILTEIRSAIS